MTEKRFYRDFNGYYGTIIIDRMNGEKVFEFGIDDSKDLCDLLNNYEDLSIDIHYTLCLLKRSIDELKYFTKDYDNDEIDITVHNLIRDADLLLNNKKDTFTGYISYIIEENIKLEKNNEELKQEVGYYKLLLESLEQEAKRLWKLKGGMNDR